MAHIYSIVYQTGKSEYQEPYRFNRTPIDKANLITKHGIEGDRKAGRNPKRQLNIMTLETLELLKAEGYQTQPGEMGEQLIIQGLDVMTLVQGSRLQLGDSAIIEITKPRTPCSWFELIQGKSPEESKGKVGMMARVIEGGMIKVNDPITILETIRG